MIKQKKTKHLLPTASPSCNVCCLLWNAYRTFLELQNRYKHIHFVCTWTSLYASLHAAIMSMAWLGSYTDIISNPVLMLQCLPLLFHFSYGPFRKMPASCCRMETLGLTSWLPHSVWVMTARLRCPSLWLCVCRTWLRSDERSNFGSRRPLLSLSTSQLTASPTAQRSRRLLRAMWDFYVFCSFKAPTLQHSTTTAH